MHASAGDGFSVRQLAMALCALDGSGFRGHWLATALLHGVARGNFCDCGVKFRRGGGYVGSKVGCHVGWLHVAAGWSLTETR